MAEADDYESLPDSTPFFAIATAGALAGVAEHCTMFPVDSVKTRMQQLSCPKIRSFGVVTMMTTMVREEGLFRPMRGMSAMVMGAGPAHAMYFSCLEIGREMSSALRIQPHFVDGMSAVVATMCHDAVMTPADVVKQRMQICCSPYSSSITCATDVFKREGFHAFYRAYPTQLVMNVPFQASLVVTYGTVQRLLNPLREYNPQVHFLAGAISGTVASTLTMPLDVCKTLLNTQEAGVLKAINRNEVKGLLKAAQTIYRLTGPRGFFSGLTARILYQAPSTAISWSVYEFFKYYLKLQNGADDKFDTIDNKEITENSEKP